MLRLSVLPALLPNHFAAQTFVNPHFLTLQGVDQFKDQSQLLPAARTAWTASFVVRHGATCRSANDRSKVLVRSVLDLHALFGSARERLPQVIYRAARGLRCNVVSRDSQFRSVQLILWPLFDGVA